MNVLLGNNSLEYYNFITSIQYICITSIPSLIQQNFFINSNSLYKTENDVRRHRSHASAKKLKSKKYIAEPYTGYLYVF